uniref:Branched-chain amino acid transport system permease protein n=1 Tax=Candidatus Kentrum sp. FM TaxID=2126340 RepID=A0A450VMK0_9GAMM|nr:MAG: branched-chain amino acid transport system permease protein [Candidatus Kentron sp. FM]VFJ43957.1 MAG: branched-chain amino acid transport system permease protein [Candidatus Kentron sp. FM]VFK06024.1 MAG: branched-chain amino acid transport system permease protein [Candidatus Kentron sp. FM]
MNLFLQLTANGLVNGALYAVLAVGFGLVWRSLRVFHVAYGGLFVVCAYIFYTLVVQANLSPFSAIPVTVICAALIGWGVELGFYRLFYEKKAASGVVLIASLGVFIALENAVALVFGNELQTVPRGLVPTWELGPVVLTELQIIESLSGAAVVALFWLLTRRLRLFKALWAMGDQPELIPVLGLPLYGLRALVLALGTALAAIPACLLTLDIGIDPHMGMSYLLIAAVAVLVGGIDRYGGWIIGAVVLALLQSLVVWQFSARWMDLITFGLLVTMLVFRPEGLMARHRRMEER